MYFNNYVYGNIRVDTGEVRTGSNLKLHWYGLI